MKPRAIVCLLAVGSAGVLCAQVDVPTANYDNNRTNANLNEGILNLNNVNPTQFGKLYSFPVDGQVYAQPLYLHAVNIPGQGTLNVLYIATMHNSVFAFDADATTGTAPLWQVNLGTSTNPSVFAVPGVTYSDIEVEIGILSTPVINRAANAIYVVTETMLSGAPAFFLHALDLTTGAEILNGPVQIQAGVEGTGWVGQEQTVNGQIALNPLQHIQRPGLLLANGSVYIGFGSHGDYVPWHGWIVAYNASNLQLQTAVFNTTPSAAGSSVWQGGRGLAADSNGNIYCATGNGNYDGVTSWGETVLRLNASLDIQDWFTPAEYAGWTDDDQDLGSNGVILIPGANQIIAGGKAGVVALIDSTNMGRELAGDAGALQTFLAVPAAEFAIFNNALYNLPSGPLLYIWGFNDVLREFQMQNGLFNTTPLAVSAATNTFPFGGMSISSNGFVPQSGILWATASTGIQAPLPGTLHAFNAVNVSQELWNSGMQPTRDAMGTFIKFANPTVANGKVYVPTGSQQVAAYGLLPVPGIVSVVNSASLTSSSIAPGELVTIFGNSIGPPLPAGINLDSNGRVATSIGGFQVTFNGFPAPLLYLSASQFNVVTPFSLAGQSSATLEISKDGLVTFSAIVPLASAAPAIFTLNSAAQGAILNSDYSVNSPSRPAARGSWISIYATGTGTLSPALSDGALVQATNLPLSVDPVTISIGGQPATVGYQGGAPGFVAGAMQINVQVPSNISPGAAVPVTISAGGAQGLNTVTIAIQ